MAKNTQSQSVPSVFPSSSSSNNDPKSSVTSNAESPGFCYHPLFPMTYPQIQMNFPVQDQGNTGGAGIYMVSPIPLSSLVLGIPPPLTLIPLTYSIPPYQTGAFTPVARWLSEWVHQAIAPPQRPSAREREEQGHARGENAEGENEN